MRICVLSPSYEGSVSPFAATDPACDPGQYVAHRADLVFEHAFIAKARAVSQVRELVLSGRYDLFFNLCDGAWDEDRPGLEVVQTLERLNVPFTGAGSGFYEPSKETMKMVAVYEGIDTPAFCFAYGPHDLERVVESLELPAIVKHFNGYSSVGMTRDVLCRDRDALVTQTRRMMDTYGGALVEEYIDGPEMTVLVLESSANPEAPIALLPVECRFPEGESFKHFDIKWAEKDPLTWHPVTDPSLVATLQEASCRIFRALHGVSYARCDFRIDRATGRPYFLEINPNCGILYPPDSPGSADWILRYDPMGHAGFVERVLESALVRHRAQQDRPERRCAVRYDKRKGYLLAATQSVAADELLLRFEERPHHLVSRHYAESRWPEHKRQWLAQYAYPLNPELFAIWSEEPHDWRPINHSCEPNAWLGEHGSLDVYAARSIAAGEEITIDYATFCGGWMTPFECRCGAPQCRGLVRGASGDEPWLRERYGSRLSPFLLSASYSQSPSRSR